MADVLGYKGKQRIDPGGMMAHNIPDIVKDKMFLVYRPSADAFLSVSVEGGFGWYEIKDDNCAGFMHSETFAIDYLFNKYNTRELREMWYDLIFVPCYLIFERNWPTKLDGYKGMEIVWDEASTSMELWERLQ